VSARRPLWNRQRGLLAAVLAVVVTNLAVFAHVQWNRAGGPTATLELTDREIDLPFYSSTAVHSGDEDTGLSIRLDVQEGAGDWLDEGTNDWLDRERLGELGFDVRTEPGSKEAWTRYRDVLPREVWLVLELGGDGWRRRVLQREEDVEEAQRAVAAGTREPQAVDRAEERLEDARWDDSRLFVIDVGLDRAALRRRYPEPDRFAVVPGTARMWFVPKQKDEPAHLAGAVSPTVTALQVPLSFRREALRASEAHSDLRTRTRTDGRTPRVLRAQVAFGHLGEPWLVELEALAVDTAPAEPSETGSAPDSHADPPMPEPNAGDDSEGD
jgi:hypothetical protein